MSGTGGVNFVNNFSLEALGDCWILRDACRLLRCEQVVSRLLVIISSVVTLFLLATIAVYGGNSGSPTNRAVTLAWDPSPDPSVVGYRVYSGPVWSGVFVETDAGTNTTFQIDNLQQWVRYSFFVTAYNAAGVESLPSNSVQYTPLPPGPDTNSPPAPDPPDQLEASTTGPYEVTLVWNDNSTNEDGFRIERSLDGLNFLPIAVAEPGTTNFVVVDSKGFSATTYPYLFRVAAFQGDAISPYSNVALALTNWPALAIVSVSSVPAAPVEGMLVSFNAVIANNGLADSYQGIKVRVAFYVDGIQVGEVDDTNSLAPGATRLFTAADPAGGGGVWLAKPGVHNLSAAIDASGQESPGGTVSGIFSQFSVSPILPPAVSVSPTKAYVKERDQAGCVITFKLNGTTAESLPIQIGFGGTAVRGRDYSAPSVAVIPAGQTTGTITLLPVDDVNIEPTKTVMVSVIPEPGYEVATPGTAAIFITDTDTDSDGDAMSDRAELVAGTDPADPASCLRILSIEPSGPGLVKVSWASVPGVTYRLMAKESVLEPGWRTGSLPSLATGTVTSCNFPVNEADRFLRIVVLPR